MKQKLFFTAIFITLLFFVSSALPAQEQSAVTTATTSTTTAVSPSISIILQDFNNLQEARRTLPEEIITLTTIEQMRAEHTTLRTRLQNLRTDLTDIKGSTTYGFEQLAEIRTETRENIENTSLLITRLTQRLGQIDALNKKWIDYDGKWQSQKSSISSDYNESIIQTIAEAETIVSAARKTLANIDAPVTSLLQRANESLSELRKFLSDVDSLMREMRQDLLIRSRPAMLTLTYLVQFDHQLWNDLWVGIARLEFSAGSFLANQGWVILLQLFLTLVFVYLFGSIKKNNIEQLNLEFIVERPYAASFLAGLAIAYPLLENPPTFVELLLTIFMVASLSRLVAAIVENKTRRTLIYVLSLIYLLTQTFIYIELPQPLFRLFVALTGLAGAATCFTRSRQRKAENTSAAFFTLVKLGGATMLAIFVTQVAGYAALSQHLLDVMIKTVFLALLSWLASLVLKGLFELALENQYSRKSKIIENHSKELLTGISRLSNLTVGFFAISAVISVWGLSDSTMQAAETILDMGISFQGHSYTLGLILTAIAVFYFTCGISWLIQRLLDEEFFPRKQVAKGVGISINRLIHYAFFIIGIAMAFSALGVGLQSLAVFVGALGIGIGFGLQNIVNNFASGLILLFERSIKVGDVVQISGEWGVIKSLGLRATVMETFDHSEIILPNSELISGSVINWTLSDRQTRLIAVVGIAYGSNVELATSILLKIAKENPFVMQYPEPSVLFTSFGASSLNLELRVWIADIANKLTAKDQINREIDRLYRENDIEIPFSQHDLHIRSIDKAFKDTVKPIISASDTNHTTEIKDSGSKPDKLSQPPADETIIED